MATAPNLVVAGEPGVARRLRKTGRFPAVFDAASAAELRALSKSGQVGSPAAFMFAPGFVEDVPGAGVAVLANGLAGSGFTVLVHGFFTERGDVFDPKVRVTGRQLRLSELLATFGIPESAPPPAPQATPEPRHPTPPRPETVPTSNAWPSRPTTPADRRTAAGTTAPVARRGRVVAVASAKGGVGKTSTTVSLSVHAAKHLRTVGRAGTVALVDTNFQQADVARYLNLESPTILDVLQESGALSAQSVRNHLAHLPEIGLYALLGPPDPINADPALINSALYRRILAVLRAAFDLVFIDTPVAELYHTTFTDLILPEADAILVPVEPNRVTLEAARSWLRAITLPQHSRGGGIDPEKLSLILNRARADVDCGPEDVMDLLPGWRFVGVIPDDREWMQAVNNRRLGDLRSSPDLEATLYDILRVVTADPVFETATPSMNGRHTRWRQLLGLGSK
ncbi:CpaE family protein [Actinomadura sp. HBU206391]|uniref:AAA family ATPase n=1 Tax=Actinomadura sp. HBU206391 TaxID=2731692 RepID=UPI00164F5F54|nr:AAA family ATPase [Actinomadura sp. HBU206391]MBC6458078.1 AAA family ATPase [Actinomadura sp. HBU206391]